MGLVASKLGRFALGLAVSGGLALVFAGSASAASPTLTTPPTTGDVSQTTNDSSTTSVVDSTVKTTIDKTGSSVVGTVDPGNGSSGDGTTVADSEPSINAVTNSDNDNTTATPLVDTTTVPPATAATANPDVTASIIPSVTTTDPQPTQPVALSYSAIHRVIFPTVTMPETPIELSAATSPAPAPNKQPEAPKSSGALTALTAELAGVVVPELFHPFALGVATLVHVLTLSSLTIIAIFLSLLFITYGQLLRRGGYATAARSDVAAFTFATPHLMDYGQPRFALVFFGGVRDQNKTYLTIPNAYQERR